MGVQINGSEGNVIATKGTFSGDVGIGGTLTYEDVTNIDSVGLITARTGIEIGARPGVAASISVDGNMIASGIATIGTKLAVGDITSPDGRLHVFNSSAGSVTAASDANDLVLESAANVGMSFLTANDSLSRIKFGDPDATNAGIIVYSHSDDSFRFQHTSNERLRIDSSGLVGVNVTPTSHNDTTAIQIHDTYNSQGYPRLRLTNQSTGSTSADGFEISLDGSNLDAIVRQRENADIHFYTNNTEKLRIDSTGKVVKQQFTATNTYSANDTTQCGYQAQNLSDTTNTYAALRLTAGNTSPATAQIASIRTGSGQNDLTFQLESGNTAFEALRIDSSGRVLIGTSSDSAGVGLSPVLQVEDVTGSPYGGVSFSYNGADTIGPRLYLTKSRGTADGATTVVQNGDQLGAIFFTGADGIDRASRGGSIQCHVDGSPGNNDMPGRLSFWTTEDDASTSAERMRISSDGYVTQNNLPVFSYKQLSNTNSGSRMTSDGDMLFSTAVVSSSHYNTSNGRFTAPVSGKYYFQVNALLDNDASAGTRTVRLKVNNSIIQTIVYNYFPMSVGQYYHTSGGAVLNLSENDYVTFFGNEGWHVGSETNVSGFLLG